MVPPNPKHEAIHIGLSALSVWQEKEPNRVPTAQDLKATLRALPEDADTAASLDDVLAEL